MTFKDMIDEINVPKKQDMEYHKFTVGVPLRLIFPNPIVEQNIIKTELDGKDGKYDVIQFKDVIDIEDPTQRPKPLNVGKGESNSRLLNRLNGWLFNKHSLSLEITKIEIGKKGGYTLYDYDVFPMDNPKNQQQIEPTDEEMSKL